MRIAFAVDGTRGDVYPLLALASSLCASGHSTIVCGPADARSAVEARGIEFAACGVDVREFMTTHADHVGRGAWRELRAGERYMRQSLEVQRESLLPALEDADFVFGAGVQLTAGTAAEALGIPYRYIAYCPALLRSREHAPFILASQRLPGWANALGWRALLTLTRVLWRPVINRWRRELGLPPIADAYSYFLSARTILAADRAIAPLPMDAPPGVEQIACLHPFEPAPLPEKLEAFLDSGPAPVYFGFGSMPDARPAKTTRQLLAAIEQLGCRALISRGWAGLGDAALPSDVFIVDDVPHASLFPRAAAIVHHGGAGTTTTAARAGVPQLVIPHAVDQYYWSHRVEQLGIAARGLSRHRLDTATLVERLGSILENEVVAERARAIGQRLHEDLARQPSAESLIA